MADPINWPGLLKWSMAYHDNTNVNTPKELSEEDKQFIIDALDNSMMDEFKRIKILQNVLRLPEDIDRLRDLVSVSEDALRILEDREKLKTVLQMRKAEKKNYEQINDNEKNQKKSKEHTDEELQQLVSKVIENKILTLEELDELLPKIDNSVAAIKYNGIPAFLNCLQSSNSEIRLLTIRNIVTVVQNNPTAQDAIIKSTLFNGIMDCLRLQSDDIQTNDYNIKPLELTTTGLNTVKLALMAIYAQLEHHSVSRRFFNTKTILGIPRITYICKQIYDQYFSKPSLDDKLLYPSTRIVSSAFHILIQLIDSGDKIFKDTVKDLLTPHEKIPPAFTNSTSSNTNDIEEHSSLIEVAQDDNDTNNSQKSQSKNHEQQSLDSIGIELAIAEAVSRYIPPELISRILRSDDVSSRHTTIELVSRLTLIAENTSQNVLNYLGSSRGLKNQGIACNDVVIPNTKTILETLERRLSNIKKNITHEKSPLRDEYNSIAAIISKLK